MNGEKMENVLVTGGGGYIGSVLVPALLDNGYGVTVLDSFAYSENSLAMYYLNPNLKVVVGDCRDTQLLKDLSTATDWIIPLAAIVGAPACKADPINAYSINVESAITLFDVSPKNAKIIMPTSNSAYGTTPAGSVTDESSPMNPISEYAEHKVLVEKALLSRGNAVSFRLATVFGMSPRMRLDLLVNNLVYRAITDRSVLLFEADFIRNFIHVRDVAKAILFAMKNWESFNGEVFNVGLSSANISKRALCDLIALEIPGFVYVEAEMGKDPDQRNYTVSNSKIESKGFAPDVDLVMGIQELVKGIPTLKPLRYVNIK
jgi:nucleoside-diphosphate-sugar epimerase